MEMLDHALEYAARGWPVFALQDRGTPGGKKPVPGSRGFLDAATNEILITRMFDDHADANVGMATGKIAGVWVLDIDGEEGSQNLTALENELGPLPETLEARTGSGGRHLFFRWPQAREVRNKQPLKVADRPRDGVDVRGEGGYVVLAPSVHPNGHEYAWPYGQDTPIVDVPAPWLDVVAPAAKRVAPWERPAESTPTPRPATIGSTPVLDRARRYLAECEPAVQGQGGHNALLWAARALVVGFQIEDATAISLLWSDFNPRCSPQWDMSNSSERRDFERKVVQARETPGEKPSGWLLDEYGLRSGADAMANLVAGNKFANALLARLSAPATPAETSDDDGPDPQRRTSFPVNRFPAALADYCRQVAEAHVVDESFVALPMLAAAGTAMGNAWRLTLKKGFTVPPLLWVGVVAPSGSNKSGPLGEVLAPLHTPVPIDAISEPMLNPQGRTVVSDATLEAVIARMNESHRGLMVFRDELAGWVKGFNAYKKSGGDEQAWLEFWGAKSYHLDRKTNNEQVHIHAAAISVLGGIQPSVLADCFDPGRFASGLVPRILVACPEARDMFWSEVEVGDSATKAWSDAILWLRTRPFVGLDSSTGQYLPRKLRLSADAKAVYIQFFEDMTRFIKATPNEHAKAFASKARVQAARLILIHRGLLLASTDAAKLDATVGAESAQAGVDWMQWCLAEQMRIYGFVAEEHNRANALYLADLIRVKGKGGEATVRDVTRFNVRRYPSADKALEAMQALVDSGMARWTEPRKKVVLI